MSTETTPAFICPVCSLPFQNKKALQNHKERKCRSALNTEYHEKKVFECPMCKKRCADNKDLRRHVPGCEKQRGRSESSRVMGPPRGRKTKEDSKEEEKTRATGREVSCKKSQRSLSAREKEAGIECQEGKTGVTQGAGGSSARSSSVEEGAGSDYDSQSLGPSEDSNTSVQQQSSFPIPFSTGPKCSNGSQSSTIIGKRQMREISPFVMDPPDFVRFEAEVKLEKAIAKKRQKRAQQECYGDLPLPEMRFVKRWSKRAIVQGLAGCEKYDPVLESLGLPTSKTIYDEYWRLGPRPDQVLPFEERAQVSVERDIAHFTAQHPPASFIFSVDPTTLALLESAPATQYYIPDYEDELDKDVPLEEIERRCLCTMLCQYKDARGAKKALSAIISEHFSSAAPFALVCLPLIQRAVLALKNARARMLHCIFDAKVVSPYHSVTINLGQYFSEEELKEGGFTKKDLRFTVTASASSINTADARKQLLLYMCEQDDLIKETSTCLNTIGYILDFPLFAAGAPRERAFNELSLQFFETVTAATGTTASFKVMGDLLRDLHEKLKVVHSSSSLFWLCKYEDLLKYSRDKELISEVQTAVRVHQLMTRPHVRALLHVNEEPYLRKLQQQVLLVQDEFINGPELVIVCSGTITTDKFSTPLPFGSPSVCSSPTSSIHGLPLSTLPDFNLEVEEEEDGQFSCASVLCVPPRRRIHPAGGATFSSTATLVKHYQASSQLKSVMSTEKFKLGFDTTLAMPLSRKRTAVTSVPSTICFTYSEITMSSFRSILAALSMNEQEEFYKLGEKSIFYDIGHGMGACVYTAALDIGCTAMGIEYAQNKFELSQQVGTDYKERYGGAPFLERVTLKQGDVTECASLDPATHIYSYNPTWNGDLMTPLVDILNRTAFRVLVWAKTPADTVGYGLTGVRLVGQVQCKNVGGESQLFHVYHKEQQQV